MSNQNLSLEDAIRVAQEAEQKAAAFYTDAAQKTATLGRRLFEQLAEFERLHYERLVALENSLRENGKFIEYEGKELTLPGRGEGTTPILEADKMSLMGIITLALDIERQAQERYNALAGQTTDPVGKSMFKRLAQEEHIHHDILGQAYWSLNNRGVWEWPEVESKK